MITYRIASMVNPRSCTGFRPQVSTRRNVAKNPGIRPAAESIMFPTAMFFRFWYTLAVPMRSALGVPNPMACKMTEVLRPKP